MTFFQAILIGILYWLAIGNLPFVGLWTLQRPLVMGLLVGIILGDPIMGAVVGGTINLIYLGFMSAGGSMPADMALAGALGTTYAIAGGLDAQTALSLAVPIGLLGTIVWYLRMTFGSIFVHMGDRYIENEQYNKIWLANVILPQLALAVITVIPAALAAYYGAAYVQDFISMIEGPILNVFMVIGGLMPALGVAITLTYIFKGEARIFLLLGFIVAAYSNLGLLPLGVIAAILAIIYVQLDKGSKKEKEDDQFV